VVADDSAIQHRSLTEGAELLQKTVVLDSNVPFERNKGGATYQTLVGDEQGSTPIRVGIQSSPPGYKTPLHSHPYMEVLTVLEGKGQASIPGNEALIQLEPGVTLVVPADTPHWFIATGNQPLKILGIHASPHRLVRVLDQSDDGRGDRSAPVESSSL
jgi:quercetin dioxygenase-like cupin family protein